MKLLTFCPLCEEKSLHVMEGTETSLLQCLYCGYASSDKFLGEHAEEELETISETLKKFAKRQDKRVWIPGILTLPEGMIYMVEDKKPMWAFAQMKGIPEDRQKDYPDPNGGFYQQRYDVENQVLFERFYECLEALNRVKFIKKNAAAV